MFRACLAFVIFAAPAVMLLTASGCEEKTVTVQQSEQHHESEPTMVSPGEEVIGE